MCAVASSCRKMDESVANANENFEAKREKKKRRE